MLENIIFERSDEIARILLNRPENGNMLTVQMVQELHLALQVISNEWASKVLVIGGVGSAFCEGAEFEGALTPHALSETGGYFHAQMLKWLRTDISEIIYVISNLEIPTIAMINGNAFGPGFDLAYACDLRIGTNKSRFEHVVSYEKWFELDGFWTKPKSRRRSIGDRSNYYYTINAQEALDLGLLNKLVPLEALNQVTMELAMEITKSPRAEIMMNLLRKGRWAATFAMYHKGNADVVLRACSSENLTQREQEILYLMLCGLSSRDISNRIGTKYTTVRNHVQSILNKLQVHSKLEAVALLNSLPVVINKSEIKNS